MLDDYSRYTRAWRLVSTMGSRDVEETLSLAVAKIGVQHIKVKHRPQLLSDNGSAFISEDLATYLSRHKIQHVHGAPYHPQTQGKIERYHRSMKSVVKLDNYYAPSELEQAIANFVAAYQAPWPSPQQGTVSSGRTEIPWRAIQHPVPSAAFPATPETHLPVPLVLRPPCWTFALQFKHSMYSEPVGSLFWSGICPNS